MPETCGIRYRDTRYSFRPEICSELLIGLLEIRPAERFLDMGSGTGIIGIYAAKKGARVVAADISDHALAQTRVNSVLNSVRLRVTKSDVFSGVKGRFDTVVFNAPYSRITEEGLEDMRMRDHTGTSRLKTVVKFIQGLPSRLHKSGRGYLVLSSNSPVELFKRTASDSRLRWHTCKTYDLQKETVFIVELTHA